MGLYFIKRKAILILLLSSYSLSTLYAQVNGKVTDSSGVSLPFIYVGLANSSDSSMVKIAATDDKGSYSIDVSKPGTFRLAVSAMGYKAYYSNPFILTAGHLSCKAPDIILQAEATFLKGVQVVSQKPFMELKLDRTVYNIENSSISSGNNVLEILGKLPGVVVDNNDAISVKGKSGVMLMIDGKMNYLSPEEAAIYLKNLNASQVEKIEIITNPSAKYDASGNSIINIVLKKNKNLGLNATVVSNYKQDFYSSGYGGIDWNYRIPKVNFYGSGYYSSTGFFHDVNQTTFNANTTPEFITNYQQITTRSQSLSGKAGADYTPTDKQTIGFSIETENASANRTYTNQSNSYNTPASPIDSSVITLGGKHDTYAYRDYNINYNYKIDSLGAELSANADYLSVVINQLVTKTSYYYDSVGKYLQPANSIQLSPPYNTTIKVVGIDYTKPISKDQKLEAGLKYSYVRNENNNQFWNVINGKDVLDSSNSNNFIFTEQIVAGYLDYTRKINSHLDMQVGLRGEETQDHGMSLTNDSSFTKKYFNLFPTAFLNWKVDSNNTINVSFGRRIERPGFFDLDPYVYYISPYLYSLGNPLLQPEISNNLEITHIFKSFLSTGLGYTYSTDVFTSISSENANTHITYMIPVNMSSGTIYTALCSVTVPIMKKVTSINSVNGYYSQYNNNAPAGGFSSSGYSWAINSNNSMSFGKGWSAEIDFRYNSQANYGYWLYKPVYVLDTGIKKKFAHDTGTITFNFSDVFWSNKISGTETYQGQLMQSTDYRDSRGASVTLSWKLGKSEYEREEKKKAADTEINRVKS